MLALSWFVCMVILVDLGSAVLTRQEVDLKQGEANHIDLSLPRLAYSVFDASQMLGISQSSLWQWISEEKLKSIKIGNRRIITAQELQRLLNEGLQ